MKIKNWDKFQHPDGKRNKTAVYPWIKLYRKLLDDREWFELDGDACKLLVSCWLLAAERNGELPSLKDIAFRLRMDEKTLRRLFPKLNHWIEGIASGLLADCEQPASRDREGEGEGEGDGDRDISSLRSDGWPIDYKERFWARYPRKVGKGAALRKLEAIRRKAEIPFDRLLSAISKIEASDPKFIPYPLTWLNEGRYLDHDGTAVVVDQAEFERLKAKYEEKLVRQG